MHQLPREPLHDRDRPLLPSDEQLEATDIVLAQLAEPDQPAAPAPPPRSRRRIWLPVFLFVATCVTTFVTGGMLRPTSTSEFVQAGFAFSVPLMTILLCHELGHFIQTVRYRVRATLPLFIPMPLSPIGTLGAVIGMEPYMAHRRALFDIGVTGPLAGLVPTLIFCVLGLHWSEFMAIPADHSIPMLGEPLVFTGLARAVLGPLPEGQDILLHPMAYAGWVGLLITSLNLFPIGQLDGGHILYALLRRRAHLVATLILVGVAAAVVYHGLWGWTIMLMLVMLMGPKHPPTVDDAQPLGWGRAILGWLTLAFLPFGFTYQPFIP